MKLRLVSSFPFRQQDTACMVFFRDDTQSLYVLIIWPSCRPPFYLNEDNFK